MESVSRIGCRITRLLLFVMLVALILPACAASQPSAGVPDSGTDEGAASVPTAATEEPTATPAPTATATATAVPSPTASPTPFPEPSDAEYNMLFCEAVGGVHGFVNFDAPQEGALEGLQEVIEPAFYAAYEGSNDLLHHLWSHLYQQTNGAPTDAGGDPLPYAAFSGTNYDICLQKGASTADVTGANLIVPQVQSQELINAACKNPNANGFSGQKQATPIYVPEEGVLATEFLADIELSDCYGFISGAQTPEENAIAHLINQYARPVFDLDPTDAIPEEALLKVQSYRIFTKDKNIYSNFPFHFMTAPQDDSAYLVECIDNNFGEGVETYYPEICSPVNISSYSNAPFVQADHIATYYDQANIDIACISDVPALSDCQIPFNAINVFPGEVTGIQIEQVRVQYRASNGTFTVGYGHIKPNPDLKIGDKVDVGDVLGTTYQVPDPEVSAPRHFLALTLVDDVNQECLDIMDPQYELYKVVRLPHGKTWNPQ